MKFWVKLLTLLLAMLMITASFVACDSEDEEAPPAEEPVEKPTETVEKEIDVYFIAGQSNAAGHTKIKDAEALYADFPALKTGTAPYIQYAGNARGDRAVGDTREVVNNKKDWQGVTLGMGAGSTNMGPEVGMAYALSAYYNEQTGKHAGIIKFAHGGTGLAKTNGDGSNAFGDWSPPSYETWKENDETYGYIGGLYRAFLEEAEQRLYELKQAGYTKINIKGLYWMQGCNDTWRYLSDKIAYPRSFSYLVSDLRADLSDLMKDLQGNYGGAQDMPFFIGTISRSYRLDTGVEATNNRNLPFIEMQKKLAENNENCYVVDNSGYDVMVWDEDANNAVVVGTDSAHWGQADCYAIGKNVGNKMLSVCTPYQPS